MKGPIRYGMSVVPTGFVVLVFYGVLLFWGRWLCETALQTGMPAEAQSVYVSPSGLSSADLENEPNADRPSIATGHNNDTILLQALGILDYISSREPGGRCSDVFYYRGDEPSWMYFDRATGHIVRQTFLPDRCRGRSHDVPDRDLLRRARRYV